MEIIEAKDNTVLKTQERFIDVEATVEVGGEVETVKRGYPANTPAADIKADLEAFEAVRATEVEQAATNAEREAEDATVEATVAELNG